MKREAPKRLCSFEALRREAPERLWSFEALRREAPKRLCSFEASQTLAGLIPHTLIVIIHNVLTVRAAIKEPLSHYGRILMVGDILMANTAGKPIAIYYNGMPRMPH